MTLRIRRGTSEDVQLGQRLTTVAVRMGLDAVEILSDEIQDMTDILLARADAPIESPYLALQEVATAYYARAQEMDMQIHKLEREKLVHRGEGYYKFRTGELRAFLELAKKFAELGSRRLSQEQLLAQQRLDNGVL
jgi:hypothetical protein